MGLHKNQLLLPSRWFGVSRQEAPSSHAEDCDEAYQAARKAQDPLADVRAIMTDNTIAFSTADEQAGYGFQIQPVHSIPTDMGLNFIARGIVPITGVHNGAAFPKLGPEQIGGTGYT